MAKPLKIILAIGVPLAAIGGIGYGLAKVGKIPVPNNPFLKAIGLKPKVAPVAANVAKAPTAEEKAQKVIAEQQAQFTKEREEWQAAAARKDKEAEVARVAQANAQPDPKNVARMAAVYEQMPLEAVTKIFALMPDDRALALLRKMDEKRVAEILAAEKPERAVRFTLALSKKIPETTAAAL